MSNDSAQVTVLVTGACGYLGSQLIRELVLDPQLNIGTVRMLDNMYVHNYRALMDLPAQGRYEFMEGDILDPAGLRLALQGVDWVIHLAGIVSTPMGFDNPTWTEQVNHWGTARLVDACLTQGVQRFLYTSSAAVYGPGGPFAETSTCRPIGPYAQSKHKAENSIRAADQRGLQSTILRVGTLFGDAPIVRFQGVANRFAYLAGTGRPLTVFGDGAQRRPLVHVRDACSAIRFCLAQPWQQVRGVLNVVAENVSILDLVAAVHYSHPDVEVHYTDQDVLTHFSFSVDASAIMGIGSGWQPQYTVEAGLAELLGRFPRLNPVFQPVEYDVNDLL